MAKKNPVTYQEVFKFFSHKTEKYAEGCSDTRKRAIRKFSENILLEDGVLFYVQYHDKEKSSVKSKRQWIGDKKMQQQILQSLHDDHAGGCHFGRDKTRDKVASRYFWHGQYDDVDYYIKTCEKCQKVLHGRYFRLILGNSIQQQENSIENVLTYYTITGKSEIQEASV